MKKSVYALLIASLATSAALAQKAGTISVSGGYTQIVPSQVSGNLSAPFASGSQITFDKSTASLGAVSYMWTDNIAIQLPVGLGFKHDISGSGALAGSGKLAETTATAFTLIGQYRFNSPDALWRPYVGGGLSYVQFDDTRGTSTLTALTNPGGPATTMSLKAKPGLAMQIGGIYNLNDRWYLDGSYTKLILATTASLSTGQNVGVRLDPSAYSLSVGYKF
jgi:outer membrane protein